MKIKRVFDVLFNEGLYTFKYLVNDNLNERKSEESKYQCYIEEFEKKEEINAGKSLFALGIIIWCGDSDKQENTVCSINSCNANISVYCMQEGDSLSDVVSKLDCDYVGFMSPGDILDEKAYMIISRKLEDYTDCVCFYSDEDMITAEGRRYSPVFKPDYSFDTIMSFNYIGGFFAVRKDVLPALVNEINATGIAAEYMILLKAAEHYDRNRIVHIDRILLHRVNELRYSEEMLQGICVLKQKIIEERMKKCNISGVPFVAQNKVLPVHYTYFRQNDRAKISIIIPSKDNPKLLEKCLESLCKYTTFSNYEVIVVDNGSNSENKQKCVELFEKLPIEVRYIYEPMQFNFSKMCNAGVKNSDGELLLFLNDDIEILPFESGEKMQIDWLDVMAAAALDKHAGAVGVKLLYPDSSLIQHTGIVNYESGAAHILSKMEDNDSYPQYRNNATYNYLCVTGACLMVSRKKFELAGGFEEKLAVTFNDVELCMRLYEAGFDNIVRNDIVLYHHESITRGEDAVDAEKFHRHLAEREKLFDMHEKLIKYDPYYSRFLNQKRLTPVLSTSYRDMLVSKEIDIERYIQSDKLNGNITGKIRSVVLRDNIEIQGYVYVKGNKAAMNKYNPCIMISQGGKEWYFDGRQVYDPTMSKYLKAEENLSFASFFCAVDYKTAGIDVSSAYTVTVCLKKGKEIYLSEIVKKH